MFHDIFSKKRETTKKIKINIDFREKNSLVPSELIKIEFDIEFKNLLVGDYIIKNTAIERKTITDLKNSIISKRIFKQMQELSQYKRKFIIIEGDRDNLYDSNILSPNSLRGFIISAQSDFHIPILFSKDEKETALLIKLISSKKEKEDISINPKKIFYTSYEQKRYILESFPNIGPVKAKKLLENFKSLKDIFNSNEKELEKIIGNRAREFLQLFSE